MDVGNVRLAEVTAHYLLLVCRWNITVPWWLGSLLLGCLFWYLRHIIERVMDEVHRWIQFIPEFCGCSPHLLCMDNFRVAPQWALSGVRRVGFVFKVIITFDGFLADVTHHCTTGTHHLIAAIFLDKSLFALPTLSDHGFCHFVL